VKLRVESADPLAPRGRRAVARRSSPMKRAAGAIASIGVAPLLAVFFVR
jgi:hypothetical protein